MLTICQKVAKFNQFYEKFIKPDLPVMTDDALVITRLVCHMSYIQGGTDIVEHALTNHPLKEQDDDIA